MHGTGMRRSTVGPAMGRLRVAMGFALATAAALHATRADAHPPWGVVVDADGCVFYSDLARIVRRHADGTETRSPAIHAHALALAPDGGIVGEETEYLGADRYRHRVWTWGHGPLRSGPWKPGAFATEGIHRLADGSTIRDSCDHGACRIFRDADGTSTVLHEAPAQARLRALFATRAGRIVFVQDDAVFAIDGATTSRLAPYRPNRFGVFADDCDNVFATSHGDGVVERIRDGRAEVVYTSTAPWAPTGVAVAAGTLRVLEVSATNEVRLVESPLAGESCDGPAANGGR